ncbi:mitochondrial ribonuclease Z [Favolaschia claudopus]|uniref:ribonuclease Z n=1 Tax=Favolaschia claudopus TaxID=2862362 RepID=A0AAW0BX94_9AGAR
MAPRTSYADKTRFNLFLTQASLKRAAGLGGLINDSATKFEKFTVVGPPGTFHYMAAMRFHLYRNDVHANVVETKLIPNKTERPAPCFQDDNMTVWSIPILPVSPGRAKVFQRNSEDSYKNRILKRRRIDVMFPGKLQTSWLPDHPFLNKDHSFHRQLPPLQSFSVESPPTIAYLAIHPAGVTNANPEGSSPVASTLGNIQAENPRTAVLILDVPSPSYIPSLLKTFSSSPFFSEFQNRSPNYTLQAIFHLCGEGVLEDERYIEFMNKFPIDTNHIISSPEHDRDQLTFRNVHQTTRTRLDPAVFPEQKLAPTPKKPWDEIVGLPANFFPLERSLAVHVHPSFHPAVYFPTSLSTEVPTHIELRSVSLRRSRILKFQYERSRREWGERRILLRRTKEGRRRAEYARLRNSYDANIITLGTSGTGPGVYRNAPSTLVRIPGAGSVLLDCGEGTWGQLVRHFGADGVHDVLRDLKCIFISSMRIDHHGGLASLLAERQGLNPRPKHPLYVVADYNVHLYLRELSDLENLGLVDDGRTQNGVISVMDDAIYNSIPSSRASDADRPAVWADPIRSWEARKGICNQLNMLSFETLASEENSRFSPNLADRKSSGVVFRHKDGWSLMYAGTKIPDKTLVRAGREVTVLIHSGNPDKGEHHELNNSVKRALLAARMMKAKHLLFTQLSSIRPLPRQPFVERRRKANLKPMVSYAFDHTDVSIGTLWKLGMYLPTLQGLMRTHRQRLVKRKERQAKILPEVRAEPPKLRAQAAAG